MPYSFIDIMHTIVIHRHNYMTLYHLYCVTKVSAYFMCHKCCTLIYQSRPVARISQRGVRFGRICKGGFVVLKKTLFSPKKLKKDTIFIWNEENLYKNDNIFHKWGVRAKPLNPPLAPGSGPAKWNWHKYKRHISYVRDYSQLDALWSLYCQIWINYMCNLI